MLRGNLLGTPQCSMQKPCIRYNYLDELQDELFKEAWKCSSTLKPPLYDALRAVKKPI